MNKSKNYLLKFRNYLSNFEKKEKKGKPPKLKIVNKKTVNIAMIGGIFFLLFIGLMGSFRAITLSNQVTSLKESLKSIDTTSNQTKTEPDQYNYQLQYYLNDYVYAYFTLSQDTNKQQEQVKQLENFYNFVPDIKSQGQTRNPSELVSSQLLTVEDNIARYKIKYKEKINNENPKEYQIGFNIPFGRKDGKFFISGLPWFSALTSYQAGQFNEEEKLKLSATDQFSDSEHKKVEKFLTIFFTNYTSNQDNLNLIAPDITVVSNTKFKTIDYIYLKNEGDSLIAYVQATFEVGGSTHSENFTFTLSEKEQTYYVTKLEHTIPLNYANDKE